MRKYPPPRYTEPVTSGCLDTSIMLILCVICPPIGLLFIIINALIQDNIDVIKGILPTIILILIAVGCPLLLLLNIAAFGLKETFTSSSIIFAIVTAIDIIYIVSLSINKSNITKNEPKKIISTHISNTYHPIETKEPVPETIVYTIDGIKIFHKKYCHCIQGQSNIIKMSITTAVKTGHRACDLCCNTYENYDKITESTPSDISNMLIKSTSTDEDKVYVTSTGKKYHKENCARIKNKKNLQELTVTEAINKGFSNCSDCHNHY